jgi:peroxiredoxin
MNAYRLRVLAFTLLVVGIMLFASHRFRMTHPGSDRAIAPDFQLKALDGTTVRLSDYRGKAILLNFWATWCPPCREEIPWFVDFQKQYGPQGLQVVGVSVDNADPKAVMDFIRQRGVNYPVLVADDQVVEEYGGIEGLPTTIYIGRDGHITRFVEGLVGHHEAERNIQRALATSAPKPADKSDPSSQQSRLQSPGALGRRN